MQRKTRKTYAGGAYPDLLRFVHKHGRKAGLTLVVGITTASCDKLMQVEGDIRAPSETADTYWNDTGGIDGDMPAFGETYHAVLPASGARRLQFQEPVKGWIDYRVEMLVDERALFKWLLENTAVALAAMDEALLRHPITDFKDYSGDEAIEDEIARALVGAMTGSESADSGGFRNVTLLVVHYSASDDTD